MGGSHSKFRFSYRASVDDIDALTSNNNFSFPLARTRRGFIPLTTDNLFVAYINLEHRQDRRQEILRELAKMGWAEGAYREAATKHPVSAYLGVPDSHISCLEKGVASGKPYICVFEDDFDFFMNPQMLKNALQLLPQYHFDVFLLDSGHENTKQTFTTNPLFLRVTQSVSTAAYLVHVSYVPKLIENFKTGKHLLSLHPKEIFKYCIDRYWSVLQRQDTWLCYRERVGGQRVSYSDIAKEERDYNGLHGPKRH